LTPGILPSALRAGFAVRTRSCACVGQQKKSDSAAGRPSKRPLRKRQAGGRASMRRYRESLISRHWAPAYAGMTMAVSPPWSSDP